MRISILVTAESFTKILALLAAQPLATRASIARQAFELGLAALASRAEQPKDETESDLPGAQHDLVVLQQAHALQMLGTDEVSTPDTGKGEPEQVETEPEQAPDPISDEDYENVIGPALEVPDELPVVEPIVLIADDEDAELAELFDSL